MVKVFCALLSAMCMLGIGILAGQPAQTASKLTQPMQWSDLDPVTLAETLDRQMVYIPAGEFWMGSGFGRADEKPLHMVYLDAFWIDRFEVTNAQFKSFIKSTGNLPLPHWQNDQYPTGQAAFPAVGMGWEQADAYCRWAGKRLPTEAEWEKVCRGTQAQIYPWGDGWDALRANVDLTKAAIGLQNRLSDGAGWEWIWQLLPQAAAGTSPGLQPVGMYPQGASYYGVMDLVGNVSEWVADYYNWGDYSTISNDNPLNLTPSWNHSLRGSAWFDLTGNPAWVVDQSRCSARNSSHASDPFLGFRCAK